MDTKNPETVAPQPLFGGPLTITAKQSVGGVFVALPDERQLDADVFETPELPRAYGGTPGINGVPPMPPLQPNPAEGHFDPKPVKTGLSLPNGMELPFWHVMFENLTVDAKRGAGDR